MEEINNKIIVVFIITIGIVISFFNVNDYTFEMLKILGIILFSIIWTFYVSLGSIVTNKYFIRELQNYLLVTSNAQPSLSRHASKKL